MEERILKYMATFCTVFTLFITLFSLLDITDLKWSNASNPSQVAFALQRNVVVDSTNNSSEHVKRLFPFHSLIQSINFAIKDQTALIPYVEEHIYQDVHQEITIDEKIRHQLGDTFIVLQKKYGKERSISLKDNYMTRELTVQLDGLFDCSYPSEFITRYHRNETFSGEPVYNSMFVEQKNDELGDVEQIEIKDYGNELVHSIDMRYHFNERTFMYSAIMKLTMNHVYEYTLYEDENAYYISCVRPKELYDKIIVIDAGHGGKDAGTTGMNGTVYEKDINIAIVSKLRKLLENTDIKVYYTRMQDEKVFLRPRVFLANDLDADFFISVHCNSSTSPVPKGTEVLYLDTIIKGVRNLDVANIFLEEICDDTSLENRGAIKMKKDDIFILGQANVPTILIETGFLSNAADFRYLTNEVNINKIADGIYQAILRSYDELK